MSRTGVFSARSLFLGSARMLLVKEFRRRPWYAVTRSLLLAWVALTLPA